MDCLDLRFYLLWTFSKNVKPLNREISILHPLIDFAFSSSWAGGDLNIPLSGIAIAQSAGSVISNRNILLNGNSITASAGFVIPGRSIQFNGNQSTGSVGAVIANRGISISGNQATILIGTVISGKAMVLSGNLVAGLFGTATPEIIVNLASVSLVGNVGNLDISGIIIIKKIQFTSQFLRSPGAFADTLESSGN